jgi:hypothetical protein
MEEIKNMKVYRLREEEFEPVKRIVRKRIIRKAFILLFAVFGVGAGMLTLFMIMGLGTMAEKKLTLWITIIISVPLFLSIFLFCTILAFIVTGKIVRQRWDSYELILTPESIIRKEAIAAQREIRYQDIVTIQEIVSVAKLKDLHIKTSQNHLFINIPASLEGYEEVKSYLAKWREIELCAHK